MAADVASSPGAVVTADPFDAQVASVATLAEPVRLALYRYVVGQLEPVSREEAAAGVGVARHVAKFHLEKLVDDGLLAFEFRRPPGRSGPGAGRPSKVYRRSAREVAVSVPERRYELAGQILARAVTVVEARDAPMDEALRDAAQAAGRALGDAALEGRDQPPDRSVCRDAAIEVLERCGYAPRADSSGIVLGNCPFHSLARDFTDLACGMNLDLLGGLIARLAPARLTARLEPAEGQCCVRLDAADDRDEQVLRPASADAPSAAPAR